MKEKEREEDTVSALRVGISSEWRWDKGKLQAGFLKG